ncbi:MAG TPA: putative Ig domain-containing protein, partial [Vicinamibacterales bacterium]|nr:putative Ig domain-containing protein [Vicinamibacterales bacterium]
MFTAVPIASAQSGAAGHAGEPLLLAGSGTGAGLARAVSAANGADIFSGAPFGAGFTGGVRVAVGDVNGDGIQDMILGSGPGGGLVRVFSGLDLSMLLSFAPFGGGFNGGVYVAGGDIDGDGRADVIVGAGSGGQVAAFSGMDAHELGRAFPFTPAYQGGVTVAAGDLDGDGHADVLAGTVNGGFVAALSGADGHVIASGFPFGPFFVGGVSIAVGDLNGDHRADIIVAPMSAGGLVLVFSGANLDVLASFVPYPGISGVRLAAADVDGDGRADIITGPGSGPPLVRIFSGADQHLMNAFLAFDAGLGGGVFVASNSQFVVPGPPTFTSASTASWTVGSSNVFSITTSGSPTATITLSGALPAGLSFSGGTGTASISGTPTAAGSTTVTLTATNILGTATQTLTLDVQPGSSPPPGPVTPSVAPAFTTATSATFVIGTSNLFLISTTGQPAASLTLSGALPSGVTFTDTGNGVATLVGTAAVGTAGTYPLTITATNSAGSATQSFVLTVNNAPTPIFTSAAATTFAVGAFGSFTVTTSASPTVLAITATTPLPAGVTFVSNGDGTATLSGTPAAGSAGPYPLVFTASNGVATATQNFLLTVTAPSGGAPTITSANATTFVVGAPGTFTITTTGTAPVTITSTGTLPSGVTLTNNGDGTATLTGTPAAGSAGVYPLTVSASNSSGTATQSFTLTVNNPTTTPVFTSAPSTAFTVGVAGTFNITTAASPAVTSITLSSGTLPTGVTFTDNANGTAKLAGTPAAGSAGTYPLTFTATNGGAPVSQSFTLSVQRGASITSASSVTFTVGIAGSFTVTSAGSPTPALSSSALPAGLFFTDHGDGTATLGGTPQPGTGGPHTLTFTATNGVGAPGTQSFTLNVNEVGGFTSPNTATFTLGVAGTFLVTTSSFPAPTISVTSGTLPPGLTLSPAGLLSGTPTQSGSFPVTLTASNGTLPNPTQNLTIVVNEAPKITSLNTAMFTLNTAGTTFQVTMTGFPAPTVSVTAGVLPTGLTLSSAGLLSGTPTQSGSFPVTLTATNGTLPDATQSFIVLVNGPPAITSVNTATFVVNTPGTTFQVAMTGFPAPTVSVTAGVLPTGLTLSPAGLLSGTPTQFGSFPVTLTATNGTLPNATQSFTVLVNAPPAITSVNTATFGLNIAGTTFQVTMTGFPTPTVSVTSGVLPNGLTLSPAGLLSGTPTQSGSFTVTLTASNGTLPNATQSFTVLVTTPPAITSANTATFALNTPGTTFQVLMTGFPPPTVIVTAGVLPNGLTLSSAGLLSGTPTQGGVFTVTLTATNGALPNATQIFTVTVSQPPTFTSANASTFVVGQPGTFQITTNAVPNATFTAAGAILPSGVTFTDNGNGTATLSGTPATGTNGTYPFTITANNGIGGPVTQNFTLTVANPATPIITSAGSATFNVGALGSFTVTTAASPVANVIAEIGGLPAGVTFVNNNNGTATLSGRPSAGTAGVYPLTITASNGGAPTNQSFTLTVGPIAGGAPTITSAN